MRRGDCNQQRDGKRCSTRDAAAETIFGVARGPPG
jgi:hypothetical protein